MKMLMLAVKQNKQLQYYTSYTHPFVSKFTAATASAGYPSLQRLQSLLHEIGLYQNLARSILERDLIYELQKQNIMITK